MAKIKINSLPAGFKLVNGKIEEDQMMKEGGYVTGDQAGYGLVTLPQEYYNNANMNTTRDESVRYSLSGVPRDKANIEAEGGETVLTDLNNDNQFGLYNITGPRHSKGGVPMFLPEQSFIYSDTDKMRFNQEELAEYGIETKLKMTPAQVSKRYDLNKYYGAMKDQFADEITARSSEIMLKKNMMGLSKLAFGQELKKKFEDGVPLAAHPYLVSIGEDPIEFTAKVENITKKQAQMKAFAALSPEQQQQLLQLQEMMAQVDQQQGQQEEQSFEDPSMQDPGMQEQQLAMADEDVMAMGMPEDGMPQDGMARYGMEMGMYQDGKETPINPLPKDHPKYAEAQKLIDSGKYKIVKGDVVNGNQMYKFELLEPVDPEFIAKKQKESSKPIVTAEGQLGTGTMDVYDENITQQAKAINENKLGSYTYGNLGKTRPIQQRKAGDKAYGSADISKPESKADFYDRWGDVVEQIPGFDYDKPIMKDAKGNAIADPQWTQFQKLAEATRKKEHIAAFGNDKDYIPYFREDTKSKDYKPGSGFDGKIGLHTFNTPRFKLAPVEPETSFGVKVPDPDRPDIEIPPVKEYKQPPAQWWRQDKNNLSTLGLIDDKLYLPWSPDMQQAEMDYVLDDYTGNTNAALSGLNTIGQALGASGGPQAIASSNIQGTAMDQVAQGINRVNTNNVGTMNQVASVLPQMNMKVNEINQNRNIKVYDDTNKTLQNSDNFKNWKIAKQNELFNTALTNRANTYNLNSTYDYFGINPEYAGAISMKGSKALEKVGKQGDRQEEFLNAYTKLRKNLPKDQAIDKGIMEMYMGLSSNSAAPDMTNVQAEWAKRGIPPQYVQPQMRSGKEIKRMVVPFYTGKMGT
jgi:hypothetical protein